MQGLSGSIISSHEPGRSFESVRREVSRNKDMTAGREGTVDSPSSRPRSVSCSGSCVGCCRAQAPTKPDLTKAGWTNPLTVTSRRSSGLAADGGPGRETFLNARVHRAASRSCPRGHGDQRQEGSRRWPSARPPKRVYLVLRGGPGRRGRGVACAQLKGDARGDAPHRTCDH